MEKLDQLERKRFRCIVLATQDAKIETLVYGKTMPQISFSTDIMPIFRAVDIAHMKSYGVELDNHTYMSNPENASRVLATLSPHDGEPPAMPPGGPYWSETQLALFAQWEKDGYKP